MAFFNCVVDALKKGRVTEKMYKGMEDYLAQHGLDFNEKTDFNTPQARQILEDAIKNVDEQTALKKKQLLLAVAARERNEGFIKAKGGQRPVQPLIDTLEHVQNRENTIKQQWAAPLDKFFQRFAKGNFLGNFLRKEADRDLFGKEMMRPGSSGSSDHAELAKTVQEQMLETVARRADAGMDIKARRNYGLQTRHDGIAMNKAGFAAWAENVKANVKFFGDTPIGAVKNLDKSLLETFDELRSEHAGLGAADPSSARRVFGFGGDYDAWKAYNKPFGMSAGDPVESVRLNMNHAANETAMLEQFGPHPDAMVTHLKKYAMEQANDLNKNNRGPGGTSWASTKAVGDIRQFEGMYRSMTQPDSPLSGIASLYTGARSLIYSTIAQTAYLSQLPIDLLSRIPTLKMINNLPSSTVLNSWIKYVPNLVADERRQMAIRAGVGGDNLLSELRKGNDVILREHPIMGRVMSINEPIARAFFVHGHMETLPRMMSMEFLSNFAQWRNKAFEELPIMESMQRHGITAHDWDVFRKTEVATNGGMKMLQPADMLKRTDMPKEQLREVATRMGMYVNAEARESVPAPNLRNRYALAGNFDSNSVPGMIVKDMTVALQFAGSTAMMLARGFQLRQGLISKTAYTAAVGTALLGGNALRMQAKAVLAGRDPYNMNPTTPEGRKFWMTNLESSGFAGPSVDLALGGKQGAVAQIASNVYKAVGSEASYLTGGAEKDPHFALKLYEIGRQFVPGAKGWYTQLAVSNMMLDGIAREVDSEAHDKQQHLEQYYRKEWKQGMWFERGASGPSRAPDLGKMVEGRP